MKRDAATVRRWEGLERSGIESGVNDIAIYTILSAFFFLSAPVDIKR